MDDNRDEDRSWQDTREELFAAGVLVGGALGVGMLFGVGLSVLIGVLTGHLG